MRRARKTGAGQLRSKQNLGQGAGTSESQLIRYFGKARLFDAIFYEGWKPLIDVVLRLVAGAPDSRTAIDVSLTAVLAAFRRDLELASLAAAGGTRIAASATRHAITLSAWFRSLPTLSGG